MFSPFTFRGNDGDSCCFIREHVNFGVVLKPQHLESYEEGNWAFGFI